MAVQTRRSFVGGALAAMAAAATYGLAGCSSGGDAASSSTGGTVEVNVAAPKDITAAGLVPFMDAAAAGSLENAYTFTVTADMDDVVSAISNGHLDAAVLPATDAAMLYNKTNGGVVAVDIASNGSLSVVTGDASVTSYKSLAGKTVAVSGKGTFVQTVMGLLAQKAGISNITLETLETDRDVLSRLVGDANAIGILPQPMGAEACAGNASLGMPLSLGQAWSEVFTDGSALVGNVAIVRKGFLREHPSAVEEFAEAHASSVGAALADPSTIADKLISLEVFGDLGGEGVKEIIAEAIPHADLTCVEGEEMRTALSAYLEHLYDADKTLVAGGVPETNFYWTSETRQD